jgi:hypothetical protein
MLKYTGSTKIINDNKISVSVLITYRLQMDLEPTSCFTNISPNCVQHSFILVERAQFFPSCLVGERHIGQKRGWLTLVRGDR